MATLFGIISPCSSEDWPTLLDKRSTKELLAYLQDRQDSSSGISAHASITVKKAVIRNVLSDIDTDAASFTISRQPMRLEEKRAATVTFEQTPATTNDSQRRLSRWLLWDHRFWIRVRSYQANVIDRVVLRPYEPEDVSALKLALQNSESADDLMQVLATNAPGDVRFTLPVLVFDGQLIGFPTLGISFVSVSTLASDYRFARSQRTVSFLLDQVPKLDLDSETSTYRKTVSQPESRSNLEQPMELLRGL
ncbi:hypothetical protein OHC33_002857 [Knufia fluminis]|uniref:Uncharacterized protein n=2 Tax=Knufia TaxID=430999 RepID=A0AAN8EY28_9EURO|nr:hypothetical protein OHC33_002857 [Knufia fluminis]